MLRAVNIYSRIIHVSTTLKRGLGLTELNKILVVKERGLSILSKSKASPCILTLILSFILSDVSLKITKIQT
jgi:hypothetical protein